MGSLFGYTPLLCSECEREVAVPIETWRLWRYDRNRYRIVCESCALLLEIHVPPEPISHDGSGQPVN